MDVIIPVPITEDGFESAVFDVLFELSTTGRNIGEIERTFIVEEKGHGHEIEQRKRELTGDTNKDGPFWAFVQCRAVTYWNSDANRAYREEIEARIIKQSEEESGDNDNDAARNFFASTVH